jgi:hypothetical protein
LNLANRPAGSYDLDVKVIPMRIRPSTRIRCAVRDEAGRVVFVRAGTPAEAAREGAALLGVEVELVEVAVVPERRARLWAA